MIFCNNNKVISIYVSTIELKRSKNNFYKYKIYLFIISLKSYSLNIYLIQIDTFKYMNSKIM